MWTQRLSTQNEVFVLWYQHHQELVGPSLSLHQNLQNKISRWFICMLQFDKHWLEELKEECTEDSAQRIRRNMTGWGWWSKQSSDDVGWRTGSPKRRDAPQWVWRSSSLEFGNKILVFLSMYLCSCVCMYVCIYHLSSFHLFFNPKWWENVSTMFFWLFHRGRMLLVLVS